MSLLIRAIGTAWGNGVVRLHAVVHHATRRTRTTRTTTVPQCTIATFLSTVDAQSVSAGRITGLGS